MKNPAFHSTGRSMPSISAKSLASSIRKIFSRRPQVILVMLLSVSLLLRSQPLSAQAPQQFSFQGVARGVDGKIITNRQIAYSFQVHKDAPNGQVVYQHEGTTNTNSAGIFNVTVGNNAKPLPATIEWGVSSYFLQVGIDPDGIDGGGIFFTDLGTTQLISVPYAIYSNEAGKWRDLTPVVQKGTNLGTGPTLPSVGDGPRLIWYPKKAAFRAGIAADWEDANIGNASFAAGYGTKATDLYTISLGNASEATNESAIAVGNVAKASGKGAIALGESVTASALNSLAIGKNSLADANNSLAIGHSATASGIRASSIGFSTIASGESSTALGIGTVAKSFGAISVGAYNNSSDAGIFQEPTDRIFQIGNGSAPNNRSNAITVLRNGSVGIGNSVLLPGFLLDVGGRIRIRH